MAVHCKGDIASLRTRILSLIARPATPLAPILVAKEDRDDLRYEKWVLHSEPGLLGEVPVLCVRKVATAANRLPVVCVLHATGGRKEQTMPILKRYARNNFMSCSMDSRYHGDRGQPQEYHGAMVAAFHSNKRGEAHAEHPFMYDTSWDMMRVIDWLTARDDIDPERIGLTGISLGGMHTWITAAADPRVSAAAPLIGVQGYRYALDNTLWHARVDSIKPVFEEIRKVLEKDEIDGDVVDVVWRQLCPGLVHDDQAMDAPSSLRLIAPRPLLVVNGEKDMRCPLEGVRQAVESARAEYAQHGAEESISLYIEPGGGHAVSERMWKVVDDFFTLHLQPESSDRTLKRKRDRLESSL